VARKQIGKVTVLALSSTIFHSHDALEKAGGSSRKPSEDMQQSACRSLELTTYTLGASNCMADHSSAPLLLTESVKKCDFCDQ
jgi:hypothetical protein